MNEMTKRVKGVGVTVRIDGFTWRAIVKHLGGGGTDYARFNGRWEVWVQPDMPNKVYRALRAELNRNIGYALSRPWPSTALTVANS